MLTDLTVFIVDDDEDDKEMFCEVIAEINNSITCISATNGQEALQMLQNQNDLPDFIFIDLNMPRMSGKQFLSHFKNIAQISSIPVIIYSTSKLETDKEETKQLGQIIFLQNQVLCNSLRKNLSLFLRKNTKTALSIIRKDHNDFEKKTVLLLSGYFNRLHTAKAVAG